jgi:hypothetical protein
MAMTRYGEARGRDAPAHHRREVEVVEKKCPLADRVMKAGAESEWTRRETGGGLVTAFGGRGGEQQARGKSIRRGSSVPRLAPNRAPVLWNRSGCASPPAGTSAQGTLLGPAPRRSVFDLESHLPCVSPCLGVPVRK